MKYPVIEAFHSHLLAAMSQYQYRISLTLNGMVYSARMTGTRAELRRVIRERLRGYLAFLPGREDRVLTCLARRHL